MTHDRRGVTALVVALSLGVLFSVTALVVDLGVARVGRAELQAATDAAALGGARVLDGTATGVTRAEATATELAFENRSLGRPVVADLVEVGRWDAATHSFVAEADPKKADAVRVTATRDDLRTFFAAVFDRHTLATGAVSIAKRGSQLGAGKVPWYLPFSLPDCQIEAHGSEGLSDMTFVLSPAGVDNTGWGAVSDNPSASWAIDHLEDILPCMHDWEDDGTVETDCGAISTGDEVNLGSGEMTSALKEIADVLGDGIPWDEERWGALPSQHRTSTVPPADYGNVLEGPIPIFDGSTAYCSGAASWTETFPVIGYVWGAIYDVASKGKAKDKNVWVRVDTRHIYEVGEWYGGGTWGVTFRGPPVLVW